MGFRLGEIRVSYGSCLLHVCFSIASLHGLFWDLKIAFSLSLCFINFLQFQAQECIIQSIYPYHLVI